MCQKIGTLHCSGLGEKTGGKQVSAVHACVFREGESCESSGVRLVTVASGSLLSCLVAPLEDYR